MLRTEAENERLIAELERLDSLDRPLTAEERKLAELMTLLIQEFEQRYDLGHASPIDALKVLMESRGLR